MPAFLEGVALTFDDVLLLPRYSEIRSRSEVSTRTRFTRRIELHIPIVSAAMDTVTESRMAIAMAREGGIGVIHRFMSIEAQVREVQRVKRAEGIVVEDPYSIGLEARVEDARREMARLGVSGLVVVDRERRVWGIVTRRDLLFQPDEELVRNVMTPRHELVTAGEGASLE
ncbi:MAG: IMP dehydrogenase, partial [Aigarchaeota archaeon]|nr:IMP dehydrogenase [Aigarchaeota archaeon]